MVTGVCAQRSFQICAWHKVPLLIESFEIWATSCKPGLGESQTPPIFHLNFSESVFHEHGLALLHVRFPRLIRLRWIISGTHPCPACHALRGVGDGEFHGSSSWPPYDFFPRNPSDTRWWHLKKCLSSPPKMGKWSNLTNILPHGPNVTCSTVVIYRFWGPHWSSHLVVTQFFQSSILTAIIWNDGFCWTLSSTRCFM